MVMRDMRLLHVQLVIQIVYLLCGSGATQDSCLLDYMGETSCFASTHTSDTAQQKMYDVSSGSCDFSDGMCSYTQGCGYQHGDGATEWERRNSSQHWFVETTVSGGNGSDAKSLTLESPLLDIRVPSCLTFTASTGISSQLTVFLRGPGRNCTLGTKRTSFADTMETFRLNLPENPTQVIFQGIGRGNETNTVRLYSVFIDSECCIDDDWLSFYSTIPPQNPRSPRCKWIMHNWDFSQVLRGGASPKQSDSTNTLTSPLISATNSGASGDCFSFDFFLEAGKDVSLIVSLLEGPDGQDVVPKWRARSNMTSSGRNLLVYASGQMPLKSSRSFRVQFSVESEQRAVVIVGNVSYGRGTASCPFLPPEATVTDDSIAVPVAAIAGGISAAVVFIIVASVGACVCWRKRESFRYKTSQKSSQDPTMRDVNQPERDRTVPSNAYTEITLRDSVPVANDTRPVSGTANQTSANDVTSDQIDAPADHSKTGRVYSLAAADAGGCSSKTGVSTIPDSTETVVYSIAQKFDLDLASATGATSCPGMSSSTYCNIHKEQRNGKWGLHSKSLENIPEKLSSKHTSDGIQNKLTKVRPSSDEAANAGTLSAQIADLQAVKKHHYHTLESTFDTAGNPDLAKEVCSRLGEKTQTSSSGFDRVGKETEYSLAVCDRPEEESAVYNRLGEVKGNKSREETFRAYDHVEALNETMYNVTQRDRRNNVIGSVYDHLNGAFSQKST